MYKKHVKVREHIMPITQERMLTCINAGLSAFNALELAQQILKEQIIIINNNHDSRVNAHLKSMLQSLEILLTPETLVNTAGPMSYIEAWHQLQMESKHFREFKSTNLRAKRYQQRKRQKSTATIAQTGISVNQLLSDTTIAKSRTDYPSTLFEQTQEQTTQRAKAKLDKMKTPQTPEIEIDYRNYRPEDFE